MKSKMIRYDEWIANRRWIDDILSTIDRPSGKKYDEARMAWFRVCSLVNELFSEVGND